MSRRTTIVLGSALVAASLGGVMTSSSARAAGGDVKFDLVPSSSQLAQCFPNMKASVEVELRTDRKGFDEFEIVRIAENPRIAELVVLVFGKPIHFVLRSVSENGRGHESSFQYHHH